MSTENEESLYRPYNFNSRTAFRTGTVVPPFGVYRNDEFGSHKIIRDAVFLRLEKDEFNPINAYVYLKIPFSNGGVKEFRMSESDYLEIIENVREFEDRKAKCSTDSFEWKKCHMDYAEKMKIDDDLFRLNTALNFFHNFSVQCRHNCLSRADQVMQVAELMINDMSKYEKKAMIDMQKAFTKKEKNKKAFEPL